MLGRVQVDNFRCLRSAELTLSATGTGIVGPNGSGKTSLLEAIYFLSHARSFRTSSRDVLVGPVGPVVRVVGHMTLDQRLYVGGVEYADGRARARLGGEDLPSVSAISELLPVQVIDPGLHRVVEEGSARRRRLLDWGVFHVEPSFLAPWRRYQRGLQQRNALLRSGADAHALIPWEREMVIAAAVIDGSRAAYADRLRPVLDVLGRDLLGEQVGVAYRRGWSSETDLAGALEEARPRDLRQRTTSVGPHRADLDLRVAQSKARDVVSRGQQKLLAAALILAQVRLHADHTARRALLLLDDPAAELDVDNLGKLLRHVRDTPCQLIATAVSEAGLAGIDLGAMFHVKQGQIASVL